jgi:hypothetical protein
MDWATPANGKDHLVMRRIALAFLILLVAAVPLLGQSSSENLKKSVEQTVEIQKETQEKQDQWADEKSELLARYRTAKANVEYLVERKAAEEEKATSLRERVEELERRLVESDRLKASIQDSLDASLIRLEEWATRDLPFLPEERSLRLESLRKQLARPDVTSAEKLRRLLETLQIEAGYGSTVEVHQQRIHVDNEEIFVDVLRLGRISLFWRTPDGERVGEYDRATRRWRVLPGKYKRSIEAAMDMAARIRPVELVDLPLGRIVP